MRLFFLLLFMAVPLAELALLIQVGEIIGVFPTIALVIATAVIGVSLLKRQGLAALDKARKTLDAGDFPVESVVDGVCLLVAGAFLLTPGLLTDTAGFLLLVPAFRRAIAHWLFGKLVSSGNIHVSAHGPGPAAGGPGGHRETRPGPVIEGEFEDVGDEESQARTDRSGSSRRPGSSPWRRGDGAN